MPGPVEPLFIDWLRKEFPARAAKIINRMKEVRSGRLSDGRFGTRMRGEGRMAESIADLFRLSLKKYRLNTSGVELSTEHFVRARSKQLQFFE